MTRCTIKEKSTCQPTPGLIDFWQPCEDDYGNGDLSARQIERGTSTAATLTFVTRTKNTVVHGDGQSRAISDLAFVGEGTGEGADTLSERNTLPEIC